MKGRVRRGSLLLAVVLLLQSTVCGFAQDEMEFYDIYTTAIKDMQATAGTWNKSFTQSEYDYALTLTAEEEGFALSFPLAETVIGPDLKVEASEGSLGSPAVVQELGQRGKTDNMAMLPGEYREVRITTSPQQTMGNGANEGKTYRVKAYRTPVRVDCQVSEIQETEQGRYLTVRVGVKALEGQETVMNTFGLALAFDPAKLKLAKKTNLAASTKFYDYATPMEGLLAEDGTIDRKSPFVLDKQTASNALGKLILWLGPNEAASEAKRNITVTAEGLELFTLTFRVMEETPFFEDDTLMILREGDERSESPFQGVYVGERVNGVRNFTSAAPDMIRLSGMDKHRITGVKTSQENGQIRLRPEKEAYREGQKVTVSGKADAGYEFLRWEWENGSAAEELAQTEENGSLSFYMRSDLDLSELKAVFVPAATELPSGALIDRDAPYEGNLLLALNPPSSGKTYSGIGTGITGEPELASFEESQGERVAEYTENIDEMTAAAEPMLKLLEEESAGAGEQIPVGGVKVFTTRNMLAAGSADMWVPKTFQKIGESDHVAIWMEKEDPVFKALTADQIGQMKTQFETSWQTISRDCHPLYDSNENGRLDVLLYDIQDGYSGPGDVYYQGLFSFSQLYGRSGGDSGDFIHLDTWPAMKSRTEPELSGVLSTMAHETGHMAFASLFQERGKTMTQSELDAAMPTWISEGLSMSIEDKLFGALDSRLTRFGQSAGIRKGSVVLGRWDNTVDSYALTYLFFQYLLHQAEAAGRQDFASQLYQSYEGGAEQTLLAAVNGNLPGFAETSYDELIETFFTAVVLKEADGKYGFANDPDFDDVNLRPCVEQSVSLPSGGAALFYLDGAYTPEQDSPVRYTGLRQGSLTLSVSAKNGSVSIEGDKVRYEKGETAVITAVPGEEGWTFLGWRGDAAGTDNPLKVTMDRSRTIEAVFEKPSGAEDLLPPDSEGIGIRYKEDGSAEMKAKGGTIRLTLDSGEPVTSQTAIYPGTPIHLEAEATDPASPFLYWVERLPEAGETASLEKSIRLTENDSRAESASQPGNTDQVKTGSLAQILAVTAGGSAVTPEELLASAAIVEGDLTASEEEQWTQKRYYANPGGFLYARGAVYTAVFGPAETPVETEATLVDLQVIAPEHKTLLQRSLAGKSYVEALELGIYGERHYNSDVKEYDLYLLSKETAEPSLELRLRWKRGQVVTVTWGSHSSRFTAGEDVPETEAGLLWQAELRIPMEELAEESRIAIRVSNETAATEEVYQVYLHQNSAQEDPQMTLQVGKVEEKENLYRMEIHLKNLWLGAAEGGITVSGSALKLADMSELERQLAGSSRGAITPDQWSQVSPLTEWDDGALAKASVLRESSKLVFGNRRAWTRTEGGALQFELDPEKTAGLDGVVQEGKPVSIQEDTVVAEIYFFCETDPADYLALLQPKDLPETGMETGTETGTEAAAETGGAAQTTGATRTASVLADVRYTAYESLVRLLMEGEAELTGRIRSYDPKKGIALHLTDETDATVTFDGSVEALTEGQGAVTQSFSVRVAPGVYTLTIEKQGHLKTTLTQVTVTEGGLHLSEELEQAETESAGKGTFAEGRITGGVILLLPGDVDGDGHIGIRDKGLLTNPAWYSSRPDSESVTRRYDLDGDGHIGIKDWNLMSGTGHYGKRAFTVSLPTLLKKEEGR